MFIIFVTINFNPMAGFRLSGFSFGLFHNHFLLLLLFLFLFFYFLLMLFLQVNHHELRKKSFSNDFFDKDCKFIKVDPRVFWLFLNQILDFFLVVFWVGQNCGQTFYVNFRFLFFVKKVENFPEIQLFSLNFLHFKLLKYLGK